MRLIAEGQNLISNFHYFGLIAVSLVSGFSFTFPFPISPFIMFASAFLNPWLVATIGATALTMGDFLGFYMGIGTVHIFSSNKKNKKFEKVRGYLKKNKVLLPVFAFLPLPSMILGVSAGFVKYRVSTFLVSVFLGRLLRMGLYAALGYYGLGYLLETF